MSQKNTTYDSRTCRPAPAAPDSASHLHTVEDTFEAVFGWLGRAGAHTDLNRKV